MKVKWLRLCLAAVLLVGMASLGAAEGSNILEDFESCNDGDTPADWTGDTTQFKCDITRSLSGSISGKLHTDGTPSTIYSPTINQIKPTEISFEVEADKITGRNVVIKTRDSTGTPSTWLIFGNNNDNLVWSGQSETVLRSSISPDTTYLVEYKNIDYSTGNIDIYVNGVDEGSYSLRNNVGFTDFSVLTDGEGNVNDVWVDDLRYTPPNEAPQFDSSSVSPDPPLIGEPVSYSADASDPDGTVTDLELTVFKDGSQVYQDSVSSSSNTWSDVYTPQSQGDLNARFVATDDAGATTTQWLNRTLEDTAPQVSLSQPSGLQSDQYVDYSGSVDDTDDSEPGESIDWTVKVDGQQIDSGTGTESFSVDGSYTEDSAGSYTMTLEATDSSGNTGSDSVTYSLENNAPGVSIDSPGNQTYWTYDVPGEFTVSDSDSFNGEEYSCTVDKDGTQVDTFYLKEGTNSTYSSTVRSDLGSHDLDVQCSDGSGNTGTASESYTVKALQLVDQFSDSKAYETENQSFTADLKTGEMVNEVDFTLVYSAENEDNTTLDSSGVETLSAYLYHEIPLVNTNQTSKNWKITYDANLSDFNTGYETQTGETSTQNQDVWHSFSFDQHRLVDGFTQLEASILDYTAEVKQNFAQAEGQITGSTTYSQTGETFDPVKNGLNFSTEINTDLVNSTSTFPITSDFTYSYDGQTRTFSNSKDITLDNIVISKSTGEKTLVLKSKDEVNNSLQNSNIELGMKVSNPDQPGKTEFFGFELSGSDTYELFLQPSYATVKMNVFDSTSLEYQNSDNNYPKRRYYFPGETLDNQSFDTSLYMLKESQGTQVQFELLDPDLNPLSGYLIRVERVFPSQEDTKTVAMIKTGSNGKGATFMDTDEKYVFSIFNKEGELVDQKGPQKITENPTTLEIEPDVQPSFANLANEVRFTDIQKENNSLTVSYVSETERLNNLSLSVYEETLFGKQKITTESSTDLSGVLQVSGFNASEQRLFYELQGTFGDTQLNLATGSFGEISNQYGDGGIFISMLTFLILTFSGVQRPSASVALGVIAIFVTAFTGLMPITQSALISIVALGAVMIWRMSTKA